MLTVICDLSGMADSKRINFEKLIKFTSCDDTLFDFLCKTTCYSNS